MAEGKTAHHLTDPLLLERGLEKLSLTPPKSSPLRTPIPIQLGLQKMRQLVSEGKKSPASNSSGDFIKNESDRDLQRREHEAHCLVKMKRLAAGKAKSEPIHGEITSSSPDSPWRFLQVDAPIYAGVITQWHYPDGKVHRTSWKLSKKSEKSIKFSVEHKPFAIGGCRKAHLFTFRSEALPRSANRFVAKSMIDKIGRFALQELMSIAAMHELASFIIATFQAQLKLYGILGRINLVQSFILTVANPERSGLPEFFSIEPFYPGHFAKFNSNNGWFSDSHPLPQALSHFSFIDSKKKLLLCDLQGFTDAKNGVTNYYLTDPAFHSISIIPEFGATNISTEGIAHFFKTHICNEICLALNLSH